MNVNSQFILSFPLFLQALILDCMLFFESCSHSVDGLAGVSCAIATEMMNHFESLDPASQVSLPGWLVALNFTIGGFTRESWTKFSLKENVLSGILFGIT